MTDKEKAEAIALQNEIFSKKSETFVELPPIEGSEPGYYTYGGEGYNFGQPHVISTIQTVAEVMKANKIAMGVGFISKKDASQMPFMIGTVEDENNYRSGLELTLRYIFIKDGKKIAIGRPYNAASSDKTLYDIKSTYKMLTAFIESNPDKIQEINLDDAILADQLNTYAKEKGLEHLSIRSIGERPKRNGTNPDSIIVRFSE